MNDENTSSQTPADQTQLMTAIDERGRRAATALHDLLDATDHESSGADDTGSDVVVAFRPRKNQLPWVLAAAAAIIVVVAVVMLNRDDGPAPVASDPSGYLLPSVPPLGLEVIGGTDDLTGGGTEAPLFDGDIAIYAGDPTMAPPTVAVLTISDPDGSAQPVDGEAVTVQGEDATIGTEGLFQPGGAGDFTVTWRRPGELVVVITSGVTREQALATAEGVDFENGRVGLVEAAVPAGMSLQHRDRVAAIVPFGTAYALDGGGAGVVAFGDPTGVDTATIIMSTGPGDQRRVDAVRPFLVNPAEVDVRGTTGIAGEPFEDTVALTWLDGDNTVVRLLGFGGVTADDLIATAESLAPVSPADFGSALEAAAAAAGGSSAPADAVLTIDLPDGQFYVSIDVPGDSIEVGVQTDSQGSATGTALSEVAPDGSMVSFDDTRMYGLVGADVARAEVLDGGTSEAVDLIDVPGYPFKAFIVDVSSSDATLRLFDAAGTELLGPG